MTAQHTDLTDDEKSKDAFFQRIALIGEEMIAAAKKHGVLLMYGEELFFTPKYLKAKEMADAGAFESHDD